jgi:hypothetical protein
MMNAGQFWAVASVCAIPTDRAVRQEVFKSLCPKVEAIEANKEAV